MPEQPLGRRSRGAHDGRAQAVEKDRRRERSLQIGQEVDDVQEPLDQVAQVVGGQGDGLGRALLAIGDQVANHRQPAEQREVKQPKITVGRGDERRSHPVEQPFGAELDQPIDQRLDGDLAAFVSLRLLACSPSNASAGSVSIRMSRSARMRAASCWRSAASSREP